MDIYFSTQVASNQSASVYNPGTLKQNSTYYWRIICWDTYPSKSVGPLWSFTTIEDDMPPSISIIKPEQAFYLNDYKIRQYMFRKPLIIGKLNITINADDDKSGIDYVEIYINSDKRLKDSSIPFSWLWDEKCFGKYIIKAEAVDKCGNKNCDEITVWKFF